MAAKRAMPNNNFFSKTSIQQEASATETGSQHDIGGEQFHVLAQALFCQFIKNPLINDLAIKKILSELFAYFPQFVPEEGYTVTPSERLTMLMRGPRKSAVLEGLTYVLRQIVADIIDEDSLSYREVFAKLSPNLPKSYLRQTDTCLPYTALTALTKALGIKFTFLIGEQGEDLRKCEIYENKAMSGTQFDFTIQVQGDYYVAIGLDKSILPTATQSPLALIPEVPMDNLETLAEIKKRIAMDDQRIMISYEQTRKTLNSMVLANELTKDELIGYFVEFLPTTDTDYVGKVEYFRQQEQQSKKQLRFNPRVSPEKHSVHLLIDALARRISSGQMRADELYQRIEDKSLNTRPQSRR